MGFPTPEDIAAKAKNAYTRFLKEWIGGREEDFFPYRVRVRFQVDPKNPQGTILASEALLAKSKVKRGWGYTLQRKQVRMRNFGNNPVPMAITVDSLDDLLRLAKREKEFQSTQRVVDALRTSLPHLEVWLDKNVRTLHKLAEPIEGLIQVTQYFQAHPWPDCYARQLPLPVDTKFVDRHSSTLRQWLDLLLPASAIDVNETTFARRFGLRDGLVHQAIRCLDPQIKHELGLPFDELSLPLRSIAELRVTDALVVIVENNLNLLTLPPILRGIAIRGDGYAVKRLEQLRWLNENRVLYWGDIDIDGFLILSQLRNHFPHVESVLMDKRTIERHADYVIAGTGATPLLPSNLTPYEGELFQNCSHVNLRLEQEKILQSHVDQAFEAVVRSM